MGDLKEELSVMQEKLHVVEQEKQRAVDELLEMKKLAEAANTRLNEEMSTQKVADIYTEYDSVKESLKNAQQELSVKEKHIGFLKIQLGKRKELERKLEEKDTSLAKLKEEVSNLKSSEAVTSNLLSDCERRVEILEGELEKEKKSGEKTLDLLSAQTKKLEETKSLLEEAKLEIGCLHVVVEKFDNSSGKILGGSNTMPKGGHRMTDEINSEYGIADIMNMLKERDFFKNELKLAMEAEENSQKAMDDLALALKEVATEAKDVKEILLLTKEELEETQIEIKKLKSELHNGEASFKVHLMEARKESDRYKHTAERLRIEADETLLTWTGKEMGFVKCVKKVEEEKSVLLEENNKLHESLVAAESMIKAAKEETKQVRDILKQALNEANVAKEAAGIAQSENSLLKDALAEKDKALNFISHENESLKISEATANENIKELKRLLYDKEDQKTTTEKDSEPEDKEHQKTTTENHAAEKECKDSKKSGKTPSVNLKELKIPNKNKDSEDESKFHDCDRGSEEDNNSSGDDTDPLRGSIFDVAETPVLSETKHKKKPSCTFPDDPEAMNLEELDPMEGTHDSRKKKALLRRFGDLIRGRGYYHRRDSSIDQHINL
ncbi:hypothetical protein ACFE04_016659 [Oxalis oulophora]